MNWLLLDRLVFSFLSLLGGGIQRGASLEGMEKGHSWVFFQPVCRIYHFRYSGVLAGSEKGHMDWIDGCRHMTPDAIM